MFLNFCLSLVHFKLLNLHLVVLFFAIFRALHLFTITFEIFGHMVSWYFHPTGPKIPDNVVMSA